MIAGPKTNHISWDPRVPVNMIRDRVHTVDILFDGFVRQDRTTIDIDFISNRDIITQNRDILQTGPSSNGTVPANDRRLDPGVIFHFTPCE